MSWDKQKNVTVDTTEHPGKDAFEIEPPPPIDEEAEKASTDAFSQAEITALRRVVDEKNERIRELEGDALRVDRRVQTLEQQRNQYSDEISHLRLAWTRFSQKIWDDVTHIVNNQLMEALDERDAGHVQQLCLNIAIPVGVLGVGENIMKTEEAHAAGATRSDLF